MDCGFARFTNLDRDRHYTIEKQYCNVSPMDFINSHRIPISSHGDVVDKDAKQYCVDCVKKPESEVLALLFEIGRCELI